MNAHRVKDVPGVARLQRRGLRNPRCCFRYQESCLGHQLQPLRHLLLPLFQCHLLLPQDRWGLSARASVASPQLPKATR
ncbi:hypothetical protein SKAU_G00411080 [Synaphobranchus kaupii]|uniref:Uncharacterized protein n=1 Tax=Synaphobranchus kaupii TaxID=118154 RepID=A0A9Q1E7S7_SYNKA|nr:hypothetical protein SKAU_G00411080 [Synaphobranchus kaupii]